MREINVSLSFLPCESLVKYDLICQGPVWVGEFGPVYASPSDGLPNWEAINDARYEVAKSQIDIFGRDKASWAIWLYKGEK